MPFGINTVVVVIVSDILGMSHLLILNNDLVLAVSSDLIHRIRARWLHASGYFFSFFETSSL